MEAGVVIGPGGKPLHWHLPPGRTVVSLPDSKDLWEVLWDNRETVVGYAHSHPGSGLPTPSWEDITSFAAIEAGLGRRLDWWITTDDHVAHLRWVGPGEHAYFVDLVEETEWADQLRRASEP